ncbi:MAG: hypothetical protein R3257_02625 [bacterium]|nr:hypothetical protein [bacterium]
MKKISFMAGIFAVFGMLLIPTGADAQTNMLARAVGQMPTKVTLADGSTVWKVPSTMVIQGKVYQRQVVYTPAVKGSPGSITNIPDVQAAWCKYNCADSDLHHGCAFYIAAACCNNEQSSACNKLSGGACSPPC